MKRMWHVKITTIPVVIRVLGTRNTKDIVQDPLVEHWSLKKDFLYIPCSHITSWRHLGLGLIVILFVITVLSTGAKCAST